MPAGLPVSGCQSLDAVPRMPCHPRGNPVPSDGYVPKSPSRAPRPRKRSGMEREEIEQVTEELPELALMVDIGGDDD